MGQSLPWYMPLINKTPWSHVNLFPSQRFIYLFPGNVPRCARQLSTRAVLHWMTQRDGGCDRTGRLPRESSLEGVKVYAEPQLLQPCRQVSFLWLVVIQQDTKWATFVMKMVLVSPVTHGLWRGRPGLWEHLWQPTIPVISVLKSMKSLALVFNV